MSTFFKTIVIYLNLCYNGVVIESIKATTSYKSLKLNTNFVHAYFFYSSDKELNNNVAMLFAKNLKKLKKFAIKFNFALLIIRD